MYRVPADCPVEGAVRYGPFPTAWWKLAVAPLLWFLAFGADGMADVRLQVDCSSARCEVRARGWRRPPWSVSGGGDLLRGAEVVEQNKTRNGSLNARVAVRLADGRRLKLEQEPLADAQRHAQQVNEFAAGRSASFRYDSGDRWWLRPVGWALYAAGVLLMLDALRQRRSLWLRVSGGRVSVDEPRRWWGRNSRSVSYEGACDVVVRWVQTQAPGPKTPAAWGATLELQSPGGRSVPLTTVPRQGLGAHYAAAAALREVLRLPMRGPIGALCPDELYDASSRSGGLWGLLPAVWAGLCCGYLAGMALYAVVLISIDPPSLDRNVDATGLVAGAVGAVALSSLLVAIVLAKRRDVRRYEALSSGSPSG